MGNEKVLYYYERTRKQQAKVLFFNMLFLPCVFWLFLYLFSEDQAIYTQFEEYIKYIIAIAEVALLSFAVWFLTHPASFYIKLTNSEFSSFHPNFKEWTFSVNPQEIIEIKQSTDSQVQSSIISIQMQDGRSFLLSPNFAYSRKKLYAALCKVNPNIKIPKNAWLFSSRS